MKKPAFTLIELLITAVLFVVVAGYAVVIFSSTVDLSSQAQRSTGAASQARQAVDVISKAFSQSSTSAQVVVLSSSESGSNGASNSIVIFTVTIPTALGAPSSNTEQRAYCSASVGNGTYRLVEYTITGTYNPGATSAACTSTSLQTLFIAPTVNGPNYITDDVTNVSQFTVVPDQYDLAAPNPNPAALHIVLTSVYNLTVGNASATDRVDSGGTAHSITVQATATRNLPGTPAILPFSAF